MNPFVIIAALASMATAQQGTVASTPAPLVAAADVPTAAPRSASQVHAIIIGNNRSSALSRRPLQYADDDAAKYFDLFRVLAPETNVELLTTPDEDTGRLFPEAAGVARPATRAEVAAAIERVRVRIAADAQRGSTSELYFVFAGHGDVDRGRGFLELEDGAFTADDVEAALVRLGASRAHVILDACNSFFVLNPRKPGGRRFATPQDAADRLSRSLPNVGVFLSTSAEAEVYEWSELQSGIFSHAVRSGLLGGADANGDGAVSYGELEAFVALAAREVKNPSFRPRVFSRSPSGDREVPLMNLAGAESVVLTIDEPGAVRLALRDSAHVRWLDVHKEEGAALQLRVPLRLAAGMTVERLAFEGDAAVVVERFAVGDSTARSLTMASLVQLAFDRRARGVADMLQALFRVGFGPRALAEYEARRVTQPDPVFGVSGDDVVRMDALLGEMSELSRSNRLMAGTVLAVGGLTFAGMTAYGASQRLEREDRWTLALPGALGVAYLGGALFSLLIPSEEEKARAEFSALAATPGVDLATLAAKTELKLDEISRSERIRRHFGSIAGFVLAGGGVAIAIGGEAAARAEADPVRRNDIRVSSYAAGGMAVAFGLALGVGLQLIETPTERFIQVWRKDPGLKRLKVSFAPSAGGMMVGLGGEF